MGTRANFRFYIECKLPNGKFGSDFIVNLFKQCDGYLWNTDIIEYLEYIKKQAKKDYTGAWLEAKVMEYVSKYSKMVYSDTPVALYPEYNLDGWLYQLIFKPAWIIEGRNAGRYSPNLHLEICTDSGIEIYNGNILDCDIKALAESERAKLDKENNNAF